MEPGIVAVGVGAEVEFVTSTYTRKQANTTLSANKHRRTQRCHTLSLLPFQAIELKLAR
jgi:hypothetical protein